MVQIDVPALVVLVSSGVVVDIDAALAILLSEFELVTIHIYKSIELFHFVFLRSLLQLKYIIEFK